MTAPFEVNRPIKLAGECFRVKFVTRYEPTSIKSINILAADADAAEKAVIEDGKAFKHERTIVAVELAAGDVYQWA